MGLKILIYKKITKKMKIVKKMKLKKNLYFFLIGYYIKSRLFNSHSSEEMLMSNAPAVKKGFMDTITDFFNKEPRELFKTLNSITVGNKHLTGIENASTKAGLDIFPKVFDSFNLLDFMGNVKDVKNHLNGKVVSKDVSLLASEDLISSCVLNNPNTRLAR